MAVLPGGSLISNLERSKTQAGRKGFTFPWLPVTAMASSHCKVSSFLKQHIQAVHHLGGLRQVAA